MADIMKVFIGAQQAEINAVAMYREFAKATKDEELKKVFFEAAADEGKHASILSKHTKQKLQPRKSQAKILGIVFKLMPKKMIFKLIAKGEYAGGDSYKPYVKDYYEFEEMMNDEYRHGDIFIALSKHKSEVDNYDYL